MCDEYWEREFARRMRLLMAEDEVVWLEKMNFDLTGEKDEQIAVPVPPPAEEKRRAPRALVR